MMSDDLDWTQSLGDALAYQQKDVLIAIQQLRDRAVADGVIKSDDKVKVVNEGDNIVIQPTNPDVVYVPQYQPQMLYTDSYPVAPLSYYPEPYPSYYYPAQPSSPGGHGCDLRLRRRLERLGCLGWQLQQRSGYRLQ